MKDSFIDALAIHLKAGTPVLSVNTDETVRLVGEVKRAAWKTGDGLTITFQKKEELEAYKALFQRYIPDSSHLFGKDKEGRPAVIYNSAALVQLFHTIDRLAAAAKTKEKLSQMEKDMEEIDKLLSAAYKVVEWNLVDGFGDNGEAQNNLEEALLATVADPEEKKYPRNCIFVMRDCHPWLNTESTPRYREILRNLFENNLLTGNNCSHHIIFVQPDWTPHRDVHSCLHIMDFELPTDEQLDHEITFIMHNIDDATKRHCSDELRADLCQSMRGFTQVEAQNALAVCVAKHGGFTTDMISTVHGLQRATFSKGGVLTMADDDHIESVDDVGGFENFMSFIDECAMAFSPEAIKLGMPKTKGCLLLGIPGCLHPDTPIYDPTDDSTLTVEARWKLGKSFNVFSLTTNGSVVISHADAPQQSPSAAMVKLTTSSGYEITVTLGHRFWNGDDYVTAYEVVERLREYGSCLLATTSEHDLPALQQADRRLNQTTASCLAGYQGTPLLGQGRTSVRLHQFELVPTVGDSSWDTSVPCYTKLDDVVKFEFVEQAPYYDFYVPGYNNYWACGLWHHNTGKSLVARVTAKRMKKPLLIYDFAAQFGSLIGQTEATQRQVLKQINAKGPCVVLLDEADKTFSGVVSGYQGDTGVKLGAFGRLLSWMANENEEAFVILTMNRTVGIPPEMLRAGRLDAVFYTAFPTPRERLDILGIHLRRNGADPSRITSETLEEVVKATDRYVGAELEQLVKKAVRMAAKRNFDAIKHFVKANPAATPGQIAQAKADYYTPNQDEFLAAKKIITPVAKLDSENINSIEAFCKDTATPVSSESAESKVFKSSRSIRLNPYNN